ncbi:hypothetical protein E4U54_005598, partial [Claviceps lovelessii]
MVSSYCGDGHNSPDYAGSIKVAQRLAKVLMQDDESSAAGLLGSTLFDIGLRILSLLVCSVTLLQTCSVLEKGASGVSPMVCRTMPLIVVMYWHHSNAMAQVT